MFVSQDYPAKKQMFDEETAVHQLDINILHDVFRTDGSRVTCHGFNDPPGETQMAGAPKQLLDHGGQRVHSHTGGSFGALLKAAGQQRGCAAAPAGAVSEGPPASGL